jgi:hypothetical protein
MRPFCSQHYYSYITIYLYNKFYSVKTTTSTTTKTANDDHPVFYFFQIIDTD